MKWIIGAFLLIKLYLVFAHPLGISVEQAGLGIAPTWYYLIGWAIQSMIVTSLFYLSPWSGLIAVTSPWINSLTLFDLPASAALLLISLRKKLFVLMGILCLLVWMIPRNPMFTTQLKFSVLGQEIDQIQDVNFLATDKSYHLPAALRKILYHKVFVAMDKLTKQIVSLVDFEQWTAPLSAGIITSLSGLPPKDVYPLFHFWEIPLLVILAYKYFDKKSWLTAALYISPAVIFEKKVFWLSGILILPLVLTKMGGFFEKMGRGPQLTLLALYTISGIVLYNRLFYHETEYRKSDSFAYLQIANWINDHAKNPSKVVVTTKFGPTDKMLDYYQVTYSKEKLENTLVYEPDFVYIGYPKEFSTPPNKIMATIKLSDELVNGFGKEIWIAKY